MNSVELYYLLQHLKCFRGVFSRDNKPIIKKYPACYVSNVEDSDSIGSHWIGIFQPRQNMTYFFCSYGLKPSWYGFRFKGLVYYWKQKVQDETKSSCGLHTVYFLKRMVMGLPIDYTNDVVFNEKLIKI